MKPHQPTRVWWYSQMDEDEKNTNCVYLGILPRFFYKSGRREMFEKVNPSHPDKLADRIGGAIVDLGYKLQKNPKIAGECLIGHGACHIIIETSVPYLSLIHI